MLLKTGGAAALLLGGMWATGALSGGYSREVGRSQAEVMRALEDLNITAQPGGPDTDPSRSSGVKPLFRLIREPNAMTWTVMSGEQVAIRMTARFAPIDATHTRVTAEVERGDAPDDYVSPAFRSEGITLGLFGAALESELNALTAPTGNEAACAKMMEERFAAPVGRPGKEWGMGDGVRNVMALAAIATERQRLGCKGGFSDEPLVQQMKPAAGDAAPVPSMPGVTFKPGEPMVVPTPTS